MERIGVVIVTLLRSKMFKKEILWISFQLDLTTVYSNLKNQYNFGQHFDSTVISEVVFSLLQTFRNCRRFRIYFPDNSKIYNKKAKGKYLVENVFQKTSSVEVYSL